MPPRSAARSAAPASSRSPSVPRLEAAYRVGVLLLDLDQPTFSSLIQTETKLGRVGFRRAENYLKTHGLIRSFVPENRQTTPGAGARGPLALVFTLTDTGKQFFEELRQTEYGKALKPDGLEVHRATPVPNISR